jgi:hypothetical protein
VTKACGRRIFLYAVPANPQGAGQVLITTSLRGLSFNGETPYDADTTPLLPYAHTFVVVHLLTWASRIQIWNVIRLFAC